MKRKLIIFLSVGFIIFMAALCIYYLVKGDSSRWQVALGGIFAGALPLLLLRLKNNPFNIPIIVSYFIFLFCSLFLGSIKSFYLHLNWWDSTLHFFKGIFIGCIGISLYKRWIPENVRNDVSHWILFLFVLSLSVLASVIWEIYEFVGDLTIAHTMQRGGNKDTMYDLIFGLVGGLIVALYALVRKHKV
ncbi:membrane-spanning protein [Neobacillus novalis]|uniref:Membrane-spanning protein n=1 Tax=Neobacillus novalis TaxID=220687 RepID=A0AA95MLS8_9BACI|nr:membrane-spanning protein [Neobacillus novalis]WHY84220.1 membrane-spanning protein [Neobacillus novalis]